MMLPWFMSLLVALGSGPLEEGWLLLDAGRNEEATRHFAALHAADRRPASARGLAEALRRQCRLREQRERFDAAGRPATAAYLGALDLALDNRPALAVPDFAEAARLALAGGDSASAAAALLDGADAALRVGLRNPADSLSTQACRLGDGLADDRLALAGRIRLAGALNLAGRYGEADSLYALVAARAEARGLAAIHCDALNGRGAVWSRRRLPDRSRAWYRASLTKARFLGDRRRIVRALSNLAYDHTQARDTDAARAVLEKAIALSDSCGFDDVRGYLHMGLGAAAAADGDRLAAIARFRRAVAAFVEIGDSGGESGARQRLAFDLMMSGGYTEAVSQYESCLAIMEAGDNPQVLNWVLAGLALTHHKLGDLDRAEHYYRRALALNETYGDRTSAAWCRLSLGLLEMVRGRYHRALAHDHAALEISSSLGDTEGIGEARAALAAVSFRLGDWETARAEYEQVVALAREHQLEELLRTAVSGLAAVGTAAGRPEVARAHCETALALARRWRDRNARIWSLIELAELDLATGDRPGAAACLAEADSLLEPTGQHGLRSRSLLLQARCQDDPEVGVALASAALALADEGGLPEQEWACLTARGQWRLAQRDTVSALADQLAAIGIVESLRRNVGNDELRRHMLRPALLPYERAVDLLATGGPDGALPALLVAERSRAQILAGRLRAALFGQTTGAGAPTPAERRVMAAVVHQQARLQDPVLSPAERVAARRRVAELETEYMVLRLGVGPDTAAPEGPAYAAVPPRAEDILGTPRDDELVASFFLGSERSWLFVVGGGRVRAHPLPPRDRIEALVRRYLSLHEAEHTPPAARRAAAGRLHDLLLGPLGAAPAAPTLVIIPDGLLHRVPFAALPAEGGPLVARHRIFIAPSLQGLGYLRARQSRPRTGPGGGPAVVAVGHDCRATGGRLHPYTGQPFPHLAHAEGEARQVAGLFAGGRVLVGAAATESSLAAVGPTGGGVLHLAAHGDVDDREVRRSFVVLARGADGQGDGLLQWGEVAGLDLDASLVTLASCRSARGVLAVGEGVTGLTQAFLFAGANCVLAVQGDIDDAYSRRFMLSFYRRLRGGESAAAALRAIQVQAAGEPGPARWADFVLVGDGAVALPPGLVTGARIGARGGLLLVVALLLVVLGLRRLAGRSANSVSSARRGSPNP